MTVYLFHCTNGSGFSGTAGTTIHVRYDFAANQWTEGPTSWPRKVGFGPKQLELQTRDGRPVADLLLRSALDSFDTIPVNTYVSGMVIHRPRQNDQTAGWRWLLFSRMN